MYVTNVDEETRKVLRRACARFKTGIRKGFTIEGAIVHLAEPYEDKTAVASLRVLNVDGLPLLDILGFAIDIHEVTPESVYGAYLQSQVEMVHSL